ncbi:MAG TPA: glutaredoxin, partial [Halomonas sp.]|nr:glutaredoxin [Halomonas sp.]
MAATTHHTAQVYRMKTAEHMCPFGLKAVDLLKRKGYAVDDHTLTSREEID